MLRFLSGNNVAAIIKENFSTGRLRVATADPSPIRSPGPHRIYACLTGPPNAVIPPVHAKAIPVILTTSEEYDVWMRALGRGAAAAEAAAR